MSITGIIASIILILTIILTIIANISSNKKDKEISSKYFRKKDMIFYEDQIKRYIGENLYNSGYKFEELYKSITKKNININTPYGVRVFEEANSIADKIYEKFKNDKYSQAEEEIKNYISISLIMPYNEVLKYINDFDFFNNPKSKRIRFVEYLADEYRVNSNVAAIRIKSILVIEGIAAE